MTRFLISGKYFLVQAKHLPRNALVNTRVRWPHYSLTPRRLVDFREAKGEEIKVRPESERKFEQ